MSRLRAELEVALRRRRPVAEYEETLRWCLDEVERVQSMIEELLELARIDTNEEQELPEPISVMDLVEAALLVVRPRAQQHGVTVVADPLPDMLVNAAPVAAKVALTNILDNAVKFSPAGGQVRVAVTAADDEAVIAVSDAGPGVSPEEAEQVFRPFYRRRASRSTGVPGVGLGLAISRVLVQRQGGPNFPERIRPGRSHVQGAPAARLAPARARSRVRYFFLSRTSSSGADHG